MADIKFDELKKATDKLGKEYVLELSKQLISANKVASGKLLRSLDYEVVEVLGNLIIRVSSEDYLDFVDKGRKPGKRPPIGPIKKWIDNRKISPKNKQTKDQLAFAIAKSIGKKGIKPTNVIEKSINQLIQNKTKLLTEAAANDVIKQIQKLLINL